jgi:o-succinylbenzoate synthase
VSYSAPLLDRVEAFHVRVPFLRPFLTAGGAVVARSSWIVRLGDREGRTGVGEVALTPGAAAAAETRVAVALREVLRSSESGMSPEWAERGAEWQAVRAGWDGALEDLISAAAAAPESGAEWNAAARSVSVAVNATLEISSTHDAVEAATIAVAAGFECLKLKIGPEEHSTVVERVRVIRAAVGPGVGLRIDANESWDYDTAAGLMADLAGFDLEYVEQPLSRGDLDGHARLRRNSAVRIALDEAIVSEEAARAAIRAEAADVLVVKPARVGGAAVVRSIAALAAAAGVPVALSTFFETGVGTAAAIRSASALPLSSRALAHGLATAGLLEHDLLVDSCPLAGGRISLPTRVALDDEALRHYTVETLGPAR